MILNPPNLSGLWKGESSVLTQHPGRPIDVKTGVTRFEKIYEIEQNGIFVSWTSQADGGRPLVLSQLGIWSPVFKDGQVTNWILYVTDYDDSQTSTVQVVTTNSKGVPTKLYRTSIESGFNIDNNLQKSEVISTVLTRFNGDCTHSLCL